MLFGVAHATPSSSSSSLPRMSSSSSSGDIMIARTPSMSPSWATTTLATPSRFSTAMSPLLATAAASTSSSSSMFPLLLVLRGGVGAVSNKKPSSFRNAAAAAAKGKKGLAAASSAAADASTAGTLDDDKLSHGSSNNRNALSRWWFRTIPQPLRFFVSGNLGTLCFYACERFMYRVVFHSENVISLFPDYEALLHSYKDSASFLLGYLLHIVAQHYLHAMLVYGRDSINTSRKYWTTLFGMYQALMFAAFGSTFLNAALLPYMHRTAAFVTTLSVFACINYVWIGRIVSKASSSSSLSSISSTSTESIENDKKKKNKNNATVPTKNKKTSTSSSSSSSMRGRSLRGGALQLYLSSSLCHSSSAPSAFQPDHPVL